MDPIYASAYRRLYEDHWWWRARESLILDTIRSMLGDNSATGMSVLDVGCGDGLLFDRLGEAGFLDVTGIEADSLVVDSRGIHAARIFIGALDDGFCPGRLYDLILFLDVLEHLGDPVAALVRARQLLRPYGAILITVPAFPILWTAHDEYNQHHVRFTKKTLAGLLRQAGLAVGEQRYFFHWMFPAKLIVRLREAVFRKSTVPGTVPRPALNYILYSLSRWEQRTIGHFKLPFGSSLLTVARIELR